MAGRYPSGKVSPDDEFAPDDTGSGSGAPSPARQGPSLKARAIALLSRREHSRLELSRKLAPHVQNAEELEQMLDALERENWQSDTRFAQSLVNRQAGKQGSSRILHTLRQHGLDADSLAELGDALRGTELDRARAVWQKKFGCVPADARERARQIRFLASRGFSPDSLRQILGSLGDEDDDLSATKDSYPHD